EAAEGVSFDEMARLQQAVADVIRQDPNVRALFTSVSAASASTGTTLNQGRAFIHLKPRGERADLNGVIAGLRPKVAAIPGIRVFLQALPTIRIGGQLTKSLYQFTLQSPNTEDLYREAPRLEEKLRALHELRDVTSDLQIKNPQVNVVI